MSKRSELLEYFGGDKAKLHFCINMQKTIFGFTTKQAINILHADMWIEMKAKEYLKANVLRSLNKSDSDGRGAE